MMKETIYNLLKAKIAIFSKNYDKTIELCGEILKKKKK